MPDVDDASIAARLAGYSWDDINAHIDQATDAALGTGYDQAQVDAHLGYQDPSSLIGALHDAKPEEPQQAAGDTPAPVDPRVAETYARAIQDGTAKDPDHFTDSLAAAWGIDKETQDQIASQLPHPENLLDQGIALAHAIGDPIIDGAKAVKDNLLNLFSHDPNTTDRSWAEDALLKEAMAKPGAVMSADDYRAQEEAQKAKPSLSELQAQTGRDAINNLGQAMTETAVMTAAPETIPFFIAKGLAEANQASGKFWDQKLDEAASGKDIAGAWKEDPGFNAVADLVVQAAIGKAVHVGATELPGALKDLWHDPAQMGGGFNPFAKLADAVADRIKGQAAPETVEPTFEKPKTDTLEMAPEQPAQQTFHLGGVKFEQRPEEDTEAFLKRVDEERTASLKQTADELKAGVKADPAVEVPVPPGVITDPAARDLSFRLDRSLQLLSKESAADNRLLMDATAKQSPEAHKAADRMFQEVQLPNSEWSETTKAFVAQNADLFDMQHDAQVEKANLLESDELKKAAETKHVLQGHVHRVVDNEADYTSDLTPNKEDPVTGMAWRTKGLTRGAAMEPHAYDAVLEDAQGNRIFTGDIRNLHPSERASTQDNADLLAQTRDAVALKRAQIAKETQAEVTQSRADLKTKQGQEHSDRAELHAQELQAAQEKADKAKAYAKTPEGSSQAWAARADKAQEELKALKEKHKDEIEQLKIQHDLERETEGKAQVEAIWDKGQERDAATKKIQEQAERELKNTKTGPIDFGDKVIRGGQEYTLRRARTDEIEKNTDDKFHNNLIGSLTQDLATTREEIRHLKWLKEFGPEMEKTGAWVPDKAEKIPPGFVRVDIPQIRGYAHPKVASVLNNYWQSAMARSKLLQGISKVNHYVTGTLFLNPYPHLKNEGSHFVPSRGLATQWLNPFGWGRFMYYGGRAWSGILRNTPEYQEYSRISPGAMYNASRTRNFNAMQYSKALHEVAADPGGMFSQLMRALHLDGNPKELAGRLWGQSNRALWFGSEFLKFTRTLEYMNPKEIGVPGLRQSGMPMSQAISKVFRDMPSYYVPPETMRSEMLSDALKSNWGVIFGRYAHGKIGSLYHMVQDLIPNGRLSPREYGEAVDKALSFAVMYYAMGSVGYAGGAALVHRAQDLYEKGVDAWPAFVGQVVNFNPVLEMTNMVKKNMDFFGKKIVKKDGTTLGNTIAAAREGLNQVPLAQEIAGLLGYNLATGKYDAATRGKTLEKMIGLPQPAQAVDPAKQAQWDARDQAAALSAERKDDIEQWVRNLVGAVPTPAAAAGGRGYGGGGGRSSGGGGAGSRSGGGFDMRGAALDAGGGGFDQSGAVLRGGAGGRSNEGSTGGGRSVGSRSRGGYVRGSYPRGRYYRGGGRVRRGA